MFLRCKAPAAVAYRGFTLAEVLVALLVVAAGIAGAVALQTRALRAAREAERLSGATRLAAALAERMRANAVSIALPDAANPYLQFDYDSAAGVLPTADACFGADCTPAQLAAFDLSETAQALAQVPGARIRVCRDAAAPADGAALPPWACDGQGGAPVVVKLGWREGEAAAAPRLQLTVAGGAAVGAGAP
ncbi:type IV pilus modification protein PilV [Massilia sp. 9096]|uniref:type IV pilus modification protein PilV n=1 Tax=Massilia sp. 9096 TaxID=1500894 RepID=UPI0009DFD677|nr:type IV pilus modification protein PilV [Massilia sp. 9096]